MSGSSSGANHTSDGGAVSSICDNLKSSNLQQYAPLCDACPKLESENQKFKVELAQSKQIENELRQKIELNATTKSSLQAKTRENEELDKK